jgi:hypothetical protein
VAVVDGSSRRIDWAPFLVVIGAACLFSSTLSSRVALGDAPESVSGIKSLGVLHAPGYPAYVLAARAFSSAVPVGGWALRANLFSVVCAALLVATVFDLARRLGADTGGAAIGAFALATSASFWFNAAFAKHYAFSGLLIALSFLLVVRWQQRPRSVSLIVAALMLGAAMGASWELALIAAAGLVGMLLLGSPRPRLAVVAGCVLAFLGAAAAVTAFMVIRAGQHPAINWGGVTSLHRLVEQVTQRDFQSQSTSVSGVAVLGHIPGRIATYLAIVVRDFGAGAMLLAIVGGVIAARRMGGRRAGVFAFVALANLIAVAFAAGIDHIQGFFTGVFAGGYLLDAFVVVAVLMAFGATQLRESAGAWAEAGRHTVNGRRVTARDSRVVATVVLVAVVIAPSVIVHYHYATHRLPPVADRYGQRVLSALPANAVLFVGGYEFGEPIVYRQIVDKERPDVSVVSSDLLALDWYREEVSRELHLTPALGPAPAGTANDKETVQLARRLDTSRPVFFDTLAMYSLQGEIGYRSQGFVGRVATGTGPQAGPAPSETANVLAGADRDDGLGATDDGRFPITFAYLYHQRAHIELAKQYLLSGDLEGVQNQLLAAHALEPGDGPTRIALNLLREHDQQAAAYIRAM